jgi:predicted amidohydrolase
VAAPPAATTRPGAKPATLVVALLQMTPEADNQDANLAKAERFCRDAAASGADVALMPEMWNIGYTRFDPRKPGARETSYRTAIPTDGPWVRRFAWLADELRMAIAVTYMQQWPGAPRNAVTVFDRNGREVLTYAKVHTSDFKPLEASMTPGREFHVGTLDTDVGPVAVGAMICFDREQPESARVLMLQGAELILTPNSCVLEELRLQQFRIRAWENVVGVAMTNYPAPKNNGRSVAFDASGQCLVEAGEAEGIYRAEFDLDRLRQRRKTSIHGNAYRRPHRYGLLLSPDRADLWQRTDGNGEPYAPARR